MFISGVTLARLSACMRSPVVFFGVNARVNLIREATVRKSSASVLKTVSKIPKNYVRCSPQISAFSSRIDSTSNSVGEFESPKYDACMNQTTQEFSNTINDGEQNIQASACEQDNTLHHSSKVGHKSESEAIKKETKSSSDSEIEDFGYHEYDEEEFEEEVPERHVPISLDRGEHGVFDVEEIVTLLEHENGVDIQVIDIPPEARFVDKMVIVSGKSLRHMRAMAASIEWLYKQKRRQGDRQFKLEGRDCKNWLAMDMGNMAVHIFTPEARQNYDLETLWTLGPEHDDQRHYVEDDQLNLSAADLFWLESGLDEGSTVHRVEDANEKQIPGHLGDSDSPRVQSTRDMSQSKVD